MIMSADPRRFGAGAQNRPISAYEQAKLDEALLEAAAAEFSIEDAKKLAARRKAADIKIKTDEENARLASLKLKAIEDKKKLKEDALLQKVMAKSVVVTDIEKDIIALSLQEEEERQRKEKEAQVAALNAYAVMHANRQTNAPVSVKSGANASAAATASATATATATASSNLPPLPAAFGALSRPLPASSAPSLSASDLSSGAQDEKHREEAAILARGGYMPLAANKPSNEDDGERDALYLLRSTPHDGPNCDRKHRLDRPQTTATADTATNVPTTASASVAARVSAAASALAAASAGSNVNNKKTALGASVASASAAQPIKAEGGVTPNLTNKSQAAAKPLIPQFNGEKEKDEAAKLAAKKDAQYKAQVAARAAKSNKAKKMVIVNGEITWQ